MARELMPQDFASFRPWGKLTCGHGTCAIVGYCIQSAPKNQEASRPFSTSSASSVVSKSSACPKMDQRMDTSHSSFQIDAEEQPAVAQPKDNEPESYSKVQPYYLRLKDFQNLLPGCSTAPKSAEAMTSFVLENITTVKNRLDNRRSSSYPLLRKKSWTVDSDILFLPNMRTV